MSLYDDDDTVTDKTAASGWASGIRMMHNQLAFKKVSASVPKRDISRRRNIESKLPPVIDLKSKKEEEENIMPPYFFNLPPPPQESPKPIKESFDAEWKFINEYDPFWPNDYEKVVKEMKEKREKEETEKRRQDREERRMRRENREERNRDDDDDRNRRKSRNTGGAAIAPPPALDESDEVSLPSKSYEGVGGTVAAKIMAKYGFREGQGLGRSKQGIVRALEVEKTSKRGGRIIAENEGGSSPPPPAPPPPQYYMPPPNLDPPPSFQPQPSQKPEADINAVLKKPSKVVMLLNMVGPGEVDDDLEPEVREECSSKYGNVVQVIIFEIPKAVPDEAVRIFVEFQRIEAATKAVIDLNGRFFGGRQVKAGFYDNEHFKAYKLNEFIHF